MTVTPATIPLKPDERAILQVLADAPAPLDLFTAFCAINPQPESRDGRSRENRLWRDRQLELGDVLIALYEAGFIIDAVKADGWNADRYAATEAGRAALATDNINNEGA